MRNVAGCERADYTGNSHLLMNTGLNLSRDRITERLRSLPTGWFTVYTALSAFFLYTCVYAFRKTFPAATFEGMAYAGVSYKVWLITFQAVGYALAKFIGIKVISELHPRRRSVGILLMVGIAGLSWLCFALVPPPYNIIFLFTNGLPLGLVWGMIFTYLEGRRTTEVLGAALSVSFIFSSGICRSIGAWLMNAWDVSAMWMPFVACCLFGGPLLFFLFLLDQIPPPSKEDELLRTKREPMGPVRRREFIRTFLPGIVLFVVVYLLLTTFRDFRENFSSDVWRTLHYEDVPSIYAQTEVPVSLLVLVVTGSFFLIKNNKLAFMLNHLMIVIGLILTGLATFLFQRGIITPVHWMTLIGLGLYLGYVPFNSMFFDRLLATFRYIGTVGFIMYVADSAGYVGSIGVLFFKEFFFSQISWVDAFVTAGYTLCAAGSVLTAASMYYFHRKEKRLKKETPVSD